MEQQLPLFAAELPVSAQHTIREALTLLERQLREPRVASPVNVTFLLQLKCYHRHEFRRPVL